MLLGTKQQHQLVKSFHRSSLETCMVYHGDMMIARLGTKRVSGVE